MSAVQSAECFVLRSLSLTTAKEAIDSRGEGAGKKEGKTGDSTKARRGRERVVKGGSVQPLVLAIGGDGKSWSSVEKYWVYINSPLYEFSSLVDAVDICFKATFVYNLHYSPECESVWQVIQNKFYNLQTPSLRVLSSTESCMRLLDECLEVAEDSQAL